MQSCVTRVTLLVNEGGKEIRTENAFKNAAHEANQTTKRQTAGSWTFFGEKRRTEQCVYDEDDWIIPQVPDEPHLILN